MTTPDAVAQLVEELKALPLIDGADLDQPGAAYSAFELVTSAILRAALVQVAVEERKGRNGHLYCRFVVEHFPPGRGRGDTGYAKRLWAFRCDFVKDKRTGPFMLIHNAPQVHLQCASSGEPALLNLQSLIEDFRTAVDHLGEKMRRSASMREIAADEVARRVVSIVPIYDPSQPGENSSPSLTHSRTGVVVAGLGARALSGTK